MEVKLSYLYRGGQQAWLGLLAYLWQRRPCLWAQRVSSALKLPLGQGAGVGDFYAGAKPHGSGSSFRRGKPELRTELWGFLSCWACSWEEHWGPRALEGQAAWSVHVYIDREELGTAGPSVWWRQPSLHGGKSDQASGCSDRTEPIVVTGKEGQELPSLQSEHQRVGNAPEHLPGSLRGAAHRPVLGGKAPGEYQLPVFICPGPSDLNRFS